MTQGRTAAVGNPGEHRSTARNATAEHKRLLDSEERKADWKEWGPYLSERAWGTVREDYSANGDAWGYLPHDHARSRAYRWNEDGLAGFCNRYQNVVLAIALWNERDPILKERLFGLSGPEGNNGEDVKEYYYYLDSAPTHSYAKMLYKYPQVEYPYDQLLRANASRRQGDPELELIDALRDAFAQGRYFDVFVEYAKDDQEDILCRITAFNRGPDPAPLHILPHIWFRNDWSWGYGRARPFLAAPAGEEGGSDADFHIVHVRHRHLSERNWYVDLRGQEAVDLLFTENDTNRERLFGAANPSPYVKDAFHDAVIRGHRHRVNPDRRGSKAAAHFHRLLQPGESWRVQTRFTPEILSDPFGEADAVFERRMRETDEYYASVQRHDLSDDERLVQRQAFAGLLWTKQVYHYSAELWLKGDAVGPPPPTERQRGRNADWNHLYCMDVISMPDKWEYPWFAAWDLAFHTIPLALIDPEWAKRQLILMLREWYMHPNGQIPAYEWNFGDVNPPVHAWAAWRIYKITRDVTAPGGAQGSPPGDLEFLEKVFHKLLLNFTWWVNRKDIEGRNVFQGGFLGLDNIGVFDRSRPLPGGGYLEQADGTAWMGMYCLNMLAIALELACHKPAYEDVATKFFEHFIYIAGAINSMGDADGLWDEPDGFYYDMIRAPQGHTIPLRVRSSVGLIPLFAVETLEPATLRRLPNFTRRMEWFIKYRPDWVSHIALLAEPGLDERRLLSIAGPRQLRRVLARMLDPNQFLSEYGLRSLSKEHEAAPYIFRMPGATQEEQMQEEQHIVRYEPAESRSTIFGGNSNWRGPIWFPLNFLMIESLQKYHHYYGDGFRVPMPAGGNPLGAFGPGLELTLWQVAGDLSHRLMNLFLRDEAGRRPVFGGVDLFQRDPHWRDHILFYEYFHGDNGAGIGASHQTGWTALVAKLIQQHGGHGRSYAH